MSTTNNDQKKASKSLFTAVNNLQSVDEPMTATRRCPSTAWQNGCEPMSK